MIRVIVYWSMLVAILRFPIPKSGGLHTLGILSKVFRAPLKGFGLI